MAEANFRRLIEGDAKEWAVAFFQWSILVDRGLNIRFLKGDFLFAECGMGGGEQDAAGNQQA